MTQLEWNIFTDEEQLDKYRNIMYQKNELDDKQTKQEVQKKLLE